MADEAVGGREHRQRGVGKHEVLDVELGLLTPTLRDVVAPLARWCTAAHKGLSADDARAVVLLIASGLHISLTGLAFALVSSASGTGVRLLSNIVPSLVSLLCTLLVLRLVPNVQRAGHVYMAALFGLALLITVRSGGNGLPGTLAFVLLPTLAVLILGLPAAVPWGVASCGASAAVWYLSAHGVMPPRDVLAESTVAEGVTALTITVVGVGFIHGFVMRATTQRLRTERDRAEAASRAKNEFLATVSHELRTPMNGVLGMTSLLLETLTNHEQREQAEAAYSSAAQLLDLVNDVLDLSKIEAGRVTIEPGSLDLKAVVHEATDLVKHRAREKGVSLRAEMAPSTPRYLIGDKGRVRQVLVNLVGNAVKFTQRGHVTVRTSGEVVGGRARVRFDVEDSGIGIAPDKLDLIFQKFTQADGSFARKYGGAGLGLSISRAIADAMGGTIDVVSTLGRGSTFSFHVELPLNAAPTEGPATGEFQLDSAPHRAAPHTGPRWRVLLAEDNVTNQKVALRMLESAGCRVDGVASGVEAVQMAERIGYDVIFMDCQMPDMDGYEATRLIRAGTRNPNTPIIALTANVLPADRAACLAVGMNDHIGKPVTRDMLRLALKTWGLTRSALNSGEGMPATSGEGDPVGAFDAP